MRKSILVSWFTLVTRSAFVVVLLVALANAAMAYTVVFRDGHKVEVPPVFTLTATTLTYEAAPGINRTVQLVLIDIPATEHANSETPGGFLKHGERKDASPKAHRARHTLTNLDLEASRQRRLASEQTYEKRRTELGLPSIEETRRRQAKEEEATIDLARRHAAAVANDEAYWRSRARGLRNEIVTVDAEINYVRARLGPALQVPSITQGFVTGVVPLGPFAGIANTTQPGAGRMGAQGASGSGSASLTNLGAVALRPQRPSGFGGFPPGAFGSSFPIVPYAYYGAYYGNSSELSFRLNDLLQRRAGLQALWRELEQDARLAKVPQIWLAP